MKKYYGFSSANREQQPAWFHTLEAAQRFNTACGSILGDVETTTEPDRANVMDTSKTPWGTEKFSPSRVIIFEEADGFHFNYNNNTKALDARGKGYPSKAAAMRAAREEFDRQRI